MPHLLITAAPVIATAAAVVSLAGVETILAIYWPVASRLKRDRCLLAATGTGDGCSLRVIPPGESSPSAGLFILLGLAAGPAALRSRIAAFLEKCLIFAGKRELLAAVAAG